MATPQSAGRTLAVHERTGRTTYDGDPATTTYGSAGLRTTGHGRPDRVGTAGLDVPPQVPHASHANRTLPHGIGRPGVRPRPRSLVA
ncbi:hypothetical protein [Streptomyces sp. NPDC101776]|uniref:hypothetical protein n=1 Tax=Streptomyces sp. NPDC101776 TaxID=3366146 RepID=UPI0038173172